MSASTAKKVVVRLFGQRAVEGHVYPQSFRTENGVEILATTAETAVLPYQRIRAVYFVRDFGMMPNAVISSRFRSRPKQQGLWVRVQFADGEKLEGVVANDLCQMGDHGVTLTPPGSNAGVHRVFVPHESMQKCTVLGVIGTSKAKRSKRGKWSMEEEQMQLF